MSEVKVFGGLGSRMAERTGQDRDVSSLSWGLGKLW